MINKNAVHDNEQNYMSRLITLALALLASFMPSAQADDGLVGYTLLEVNTINGTFEGCNFDRIINFMDGSTLKCDEYEYAYGYMPEAKIYGQLRSYNNVSFADIKMVVDGDVFDMQAIFHRN